MKKLPILKPNDTIEIIAPASRCTDAQLDDLKSLLASWQLNCVVADDIFGKELFSANTDAIRFKHLQNALLNPNTKAIICARGGYGSMRLIPMLAKLTKPATPKIFIGMSDATALHLYLQNKWRWPTIHGAIARDKFSPEAIKSVQDIMFGNVKNVEFVNLTPLNEAAKANITVDASITGGNLCLVQTSIGTAWQINGKNKIILLEDVGERGYRIDRMLEHLKQANVFENAAAICFGDFLDGAEPDGTFLIKQALKRFAENVTIPVVQITGIGHGFVNFPIILGTAAKLELGASAKLICKR